MCEWEMEESHRELKAAVMAGRSTSFSHATKCGRLITSHYHVQSRSETEVR